MKKFFLLFLILSFLPSNLIAQNEKQDSTPILPRVIILATGGTIAGVSDTSAKTAYTPGKLAIEDLLHAVPQIHDIAQITGEQIAQLGSQNMNKAIWLKLSKRVNEIFDNDLADGIVITHGTDTLEETAYFLDLTVNSDKPVVLVGAMRPANTIGQDGNKNLLDAVLVAASPKSKEIGVVATMNEEIYTARDVTKTSTTNVAAFKARNYGPIGLVYNNIVMYYYTPIRSSNKKFNIQKIKNLPQVEIVYGYADASPKPINALISEKVKGIIYAGMGNGNFNETVGVALENAVKKGIIVCRASRTGSGNVTLGNEIDDEKFGFIVADDLLPQKARILLMLALTETQNKEKLQNIFFEY